VVSEPQKGLNKEDSSTLFKEGRNGLRGRRSYFYYYPDFCYGVANQKGQDAGCAAGAATRISSTIQQMVKEKSRLSRVVQEACGGESEGMTLLTGGENMKCGVACGRLFSLSDIKK